MASIVKSGGGENVAAEVQAQTPIIAEIAENLGITITTPSGTNKHILHGNNENLQLIASKTELKIVTWAGGTDDEIAAMVKAADEGKINLSDYWAVGDTRTVHLSAMSATYVDERHEEQDVELVLMHAGGYELADGSTCNFVVGQKDCLVDTGRFYLEGSGSWDKLARREWCNNSYKNAIPLTLQPIFKQFKTIAAETGFGTTLKTSLDYFALPAAKEIFGGDIATEAGEATKYSNLTEFNSLFQFDWYKTSANRIKKIRGNAEYWWERSVIFENYYAYCCVSSEGNGVYNSADYEYGLSPFGCI